MYCLTGLGDAESVHVPWQATDTYFDLLPIQVPNMAWVELSLIFTLENNKFFQMFTT